MLIRLATRRFAIKKEHPTSNVNTNVSDDRCHLVYESSNYSGQGVQVLFTSTTCSVDNIFSTTSVRSIGADVRALLSVRMFHRSNTSSQGVRDFFGLFSHVSQYQHIRSCDRKSLHFEGRESVNAAFALHHPASSTQGSQGNQSVNCALSSHQVQNG